MGTIDDLSATVDVRKSALSIPQMKARPRLSKAVLYAGFHGSEEAKVDAVISSLGQVWNTPSALPGHFVDLGCGDGRVVLEVSRAFPTKLCFGIDLQAVMIEKARALAKRHKAGPNCELYVGDLATADLSNASVVFLYFPPMALPGVLSALCASNMRNGTIIISADGPWKSRDRQEKGGEHSRHARWEMSQGELLGLLHPCRHCWGTADVFFYTWRGNSAKHPDSEMLEATKAAAADAGVQAAVARLSLRREAEAAKEAQRAAAVQEALEVQAAARAAKVEEARAEKAKALAAAGTTNTTFFRPVTAQQLKAANLANDAIARKRHAEHRARMAQRFSRLSLKLELGPYNRPVAPIAESWRPQQKLRPITVHGCQTQNDRMPAYGRKQAPSNMPLFAI